ncbi:hypothetical protein [Tropicimonas sp. IMCC6043]|uniref:hypothetical protein n=1 Tax=Tropicimonas sp. IMCC6043 TaxID=2510645 RepID=UPI0013EA5F79
MPTPGGVVGIVEADADELADMADAGADAAVRVKHRQPGDIGGGDDRQPFIGQHVTGDIADDAGQIADRPVQMQ